ncbi:hypothetical protein V502_08815 [Pseudogymnoascus sp. VKM F-4520 (FW-2644)]|nr:hypothetical protein V502_08815 [Pseudogymnoascus sp. VKM F-4520 (FW-2644)]
MKKARIATHTKKELKPKYTIGLEDARKLHTEALKNIKNDLEGNHTVDIQEAQKLHTEALEKIKNEFGSKYILYDYARNGAALKVVGDSLLLAVVR